MAAKIVSLKWFFRAPIFRSRLEARSKKNSNTNPVNAKCRLQIGYKMQTRYKMQTAGWVQIADWEFILIFVWYVITCHLTTYRGSRNCFSAIIFHNYLHYCGIFLARFLIKIILNIISSFHLAFSLCARVGWCDVCTDFTDLMKVGIDVNEVSLLNI